MNRFSYAGMSLAMGLVLMAPQEAEAQAGDGWWEWALQEVADVRPSDRNGDEARRGGRTIGDIILGRDGRRDDRDRDRDRDRQKADRKKNGRNAAAGKGPPFCRNGQGHPVHGRQWCRDKGFGMGQGSLRWEDRGWEEVVLGTPRRDDRRQGTMDRGGLIDVLGDVVFRRVDGERQRLGGNSPLEGRWLELRNGARVLQIRSGSTPVAELTDLDGDGRVDVTLVPRK